jgi:transcription initiation factor TFIIB
MPTEKSPRYKKDPICTPEGEWIDPKTGEVLGYETDRGPERRAFDEEQRRKRTRTGAPQTYTIHDKGLSTMIDWYDRDAYGKKLTPPQVSEVHRLRRWQRRIRTSDANERTRANALAYINRIGNRLNFPKNVLETASVIFIKAQNEHLIRGRSVEGVASAAMYVACRQCELPKMLEEIAEASYNDGMSEKEWKKEIARSYRLLVKELNYSIPLLKPSKYITKFSNQLTMQGEVENIAHKIMAIATDLKMTSGRAPTGQAAAASYIASVLTGERKTQREIAEIAQVTEVTVRNRYKELVERLMLEVSL